MMEVPHPPHRVVIIGGGISGLALAHRLSELRREHHLPLELTLLEAHERVGGVIETQQHDGWLLESGPDAFLSEKPWAVDLCRRLGMTEQLIETQSSFRRSFVLLRGRLVQIPQGWYLIAPSRLSTLWRTPLLSVSGKLRMAMEPLIPSRRAADDESMASFLRRRVGQEALERIGQPMIGGIYTADPETLSLQATFPQFAQMERTHGSILRGLWAQRQQRGQATRAASGPRYSLFLTLRHGLQTLVDALVRAMMPSVSLRCRAVVAGISRTRTWTLTLEDGGTLEAETLCLALPAHRAATLLKEVTPPLAQMLAAIPYASVATVNMAFRAADVPRPLDGFGVVIPAIERRRIVGCTCASLKFPGRAPQGTVLLRAFVGGALDHQWYELDDQAMAQMVREELYLLFGIEHPPLLTSIRRFPQAMPQYLVGHLERLAAIETHAERTPGLYLTGNGYRGIGIPDCIHQAELTAQRIMERLVAFQPHAPVSATS